MRIDILKETVSIRTHATEAELPEAIKLLVGKALVEEIVPHIIKVHSDADFEQTGIFEIILWGD